MFLALSYPPTEAKHQTAALGIMSIGLVGTEINGAQIGGNKITNTTTYTISAGTTNEVAPVDQQKANSERWQRGRSRFFALGLALCLVAAFDADAAPTQTSGVHLVYATDKAVCGAIETYLQRIDHQYPRSTQRERLLLLDPFLKKFRPLLPPELTVPTPVEDVSFEDPPDGVPHFALYSIILDSASGKEQLVSVNDEPTSSGDFTSNLYLFKPGVPRNIAFENLAPPRDTVVNAITFPLDVSKYRSIPATYFFEKLYDDRNRDQPIDWRIAHDLWLGGTHAVRLFGQNNDTFILAGYPLFDTGLALKITAAGNFEDACYYKYIERLAGRSIPMKH